jgi:hypothetical protein
VEYVAEITVYDPAEAGTRVLRFVTGRAFTTGATDTPPHTLIDGRVLQPALLRRDLFDLGTLGGASRVGFGDLVLANADGALDAFRGFGVDGRELVVRASTEPAAAFPAGWPVLFRGTMAGADTGLDTVTIRLRDRQAFAEQPVQRTLFAGTNVLPEGLEGGESDLRGKPKPITRGWVRNIEPVLVNTSRLIYQVNDGPVRDVVACMDAGAALRLGLAYADVSDLFATPPLPGTYRVCPTAGYLRLGSAPVGQVTCDVVEGTTPFDRTAAQLVRRLLLGPVGLTPDQLVESDFTALDAAQPAQCGVYLTEVTPVQDVLDRLAQSVGAWWGTDVDGRFRLRRLEAPTEEPVLTFEAGDLVRLARLPLAEAGGGIPASRITVRAVRNHTVQTSGLAGVVGAARRARVAQPYQDAIADDDSVRTMHPLAPQRTVETALACLADAQAEAARLLTLYGVPRDRYEARVVLDQTVLAALDLGVVVALRYPRYGLDTGQRFRVLGYQLDPVTQVADLTLWG